MAWLIKGIGWFAVLLSLAVSCLLASAGIGQILFEGWYAPSVQENMGMVVDALLAPFVFVVFALFGLVWPRIGGSFHLLVGSFLVISPFLVRCALIPGPNHSHSWDPWIVIQLSGIVLVVMGIAYWKGRPQPIWLATGLVIGLPIAVSMLCAAEPMWRILHRQDDGITAARQVQGNGLALVWAPASPGWSTEGNVRLDEAEKIVSCLTEDGMSLADSPQNIWRLPTIDEVARSLTRDGQNAGGQWHSGSEQATYRVTPDKESPLWQVHSSVVTWWTSTRSPERPQHVSYIISYRGEVSKCYTFTCSPHVGFRAVKGR